MDVRLALSIHAGMTVTEQVDGDHPILFQRQPIVAMLGRTRSGLPNQPMLIDSAQKFAREFGGTWAESRLPDAVQQFFSAGGRKLIVVRLCNAATAARLDLPLGTSRLTLESRFPGAAESLRAELDIPEPGQGGLHLTLQRLVDGQILDQELFSDLSLDPANDRFVATELARSELVHVVSDAATLAQNASTAAFAGQRPGRLTLAARSGTDGAPLSDYDLIGSPAGGTGLFALDTVAQVDFIYVPPAVEASRSRALFETAAARYCEERAALLVIDPEPEATEPPTRQHQDLRMPVIRYWPPLVYRTARERRIAAGGAILGALANWQYVGYGNFGFCPDNTRLGRRYQTDPKASSERLAQLGEHGVFVLTARRDQTISIHPALLYVPDLGCRCTLHTLRLVLLVERAIEDSTRWIVACADDPAAWLTLARQVNDFLTRLARAGLIMDGDFRVRCDAITNARHKTDSANTHFLVTFRPREFARRLTLSVTQAPAGPHVTRAAFSD